MINLEAWFIWALVSAIFAALTAVLAKLGLQGIDSDFATFIRIVVILVALAFFLSYTGKWHDISTLTVRNWLFLVLSGLATGISWLAYFKALQLGHASQVAPIDKLSIVFVVLMAVTFLGDRPSTREWIGIACIVLGVLVLAFKK